MGLRVENVWQQALILLREAVGAAGVDASPKTLGQYGRSMSGNETVPAGVVFPATAGEVQKVVQIANQLGLTLYPISRGRNWGYGDACAPTHGEVIVDLCRLNKILEVDVELGYVVIESGVSQGQLSEYLRSHDLPLWMDATAAGPDASIVGNVLERGFGHTSYGDRFANVCSIDVVLGDGRLLKTGYGHYEKSKAKYAYRYGVGPFLDGLFQQSNFGIVTSVGLWLMPKPQNFCAFFFQADDPEALSDLVGRLRPLRMQGLLRSTIHIGNDLRALSGRVNYPWKLMKETTPMTSEVRHQLRRQFGVGAWVGCGALYGTAATNAGVKKELRRALKGYQLTFIDDRRMSFAKKIARFLGRFEIGKKIREQIKTAEPVFELLKGNPNGESLQGAYWRLKPDVGRNAKDPLATDAGLLWVAPIVPMTGEAAQEVLNLVTPIYNKYGFDCLATFTMITERAMCCVTNISYDKTKADEVALAKRCYDELMTVLSSNGYVSYRTGPSGYQHLAMGSINFWDTVVDIKKVLDPNGVISPTRYSPALRRTKKK